MTHEAVVLLLGEVSKDLRGEMFSPHVGKSAPPYYAASVPRQIAIDGVHSEINGREVTFELRGYPPDVLLIQARIVLDDVFSLGTFDVESRLLERAREILGENGGSTEFSEEYTVFIVSGYAGEPEQFLDHGEIIASLLKSERQELAAREVEYTLQSQIKYARDDLAIVDWDGAFLFDPAGDVAQEIELLTLANLQLLRHRTLDRALDWRLARMAELVQRPEGTPLSFRPKDIERGLIETIDARTKSISELQRLDRDIKLIGDWYSARFFEATAGKFKIPDWRRSIQSKLESIEDIYSIVAENFSVSRKHRAEWIQIVVFFILQLGWFALIVLELFYFTRQVGAQ
ncbi:MAG: hypothetical protein JXL80_01800 [Planctomycetes bacterium]|nr:hypothetical protein [Planctomycetota bacterium]